MHIYTIKKNPNATFAIQKDGNGCLCPKSMVVMPVQTMSGQSLQPTQMACSTICPFANIVSRPVKQDKVLGNIGDSGRSVETVKGEVPVQLFYVIDCEGRTKEFELQEPKEAKPGVSKLVQMP